MKPSKGMWTECRTLSEKDYQGKKDDEDEKSQKLSALKTAMELLIVPIFVLYLFCRRVEGMYFSKSYALNLIIHV